MRILLILLSTPIIGFLVSAWCVRTVARWFGAARPTYRRASAAVAASTAIGIGLPLGCLWLGNSLDVQDFVDSVPFAIVLLVGETALICLAVASLLGMTLVRAFLVWIGGFLLPSLASIALVALLFRPFVGEAFKVSSNAMAPTLVGWHWHGVCPNCQGELIIPAPSPGDANARYEEQPYSICGRCFRTCHVNAGKQPAERPDRVVVDKLERPQRWDLTVFRAPIDTPAIFVMRIVGLPGESVFVEDGKVWVEDQPIALPSPLKGLQYSAEDFDGMMGSRKRPWHLAHDEYCLLGDFSSRARDSRFFGAVQRSDIIGVVTARYWPPSRWKIFD